MYDEPSQVPSSTSARFRFDEAHTLLNRQVHKGDHIQIVKVGDDQLDLDAQALAALYE